jgi:hypothetical protein
VLPNEIRFYEKKMTLQDFLVLVKYEKGLALFSFEVSLIPNIALLIAANLFCFSTVPTSELILLFKESTILANWIIVIY